MENNLDKSMRRENEREDGELKMERWRVKMKASRPEIGTSGPNASRVSVFDHRGKPLAPRAELQTLSKKSPSDFSLRTRTRAQQ